MKKPSGMQLFLWVEHTTESRFGWAKVRYRPCRYSLVQIQVMNPTGDSSVAGSGLKERPSTTSPSGLKDRFGSTALTVSKLDRFKAPRTDARKDHNIEMLAVSLCMLVEKKVPCTPDIS